jgi:hypothetical protein
MKNERRPLSPKQHEVLKTLVLWTQQHHAQPSAKEIATVIGVSNVQKYLTELEAKGWIHRSSVPRSIEIPEDVYNEILKGEENGR